MARGLLWRGDLSPLGCAAAPKSRQLSKILGSASHSNGDKSPRHKSPHHRSLLTTGKLAGIKAAVTLRRCHPPASNPRL
ncbi:hypothetical protein DJ564_26530 [Pseudomonas sp. 31-12]|nr:hypothetical protein DJ564_26530 [Pseudomonas sp. 31-12]